MPCVTQTRVVSSVKTKSCELGGDSTSNSIHGLHYFHQVGKAGGQVHIDVVDGTRGELIHADNVSPHLRFCPYGWPDVIGRHRRRHVWRSTAVSTALYGTEQPTTVSNSLARPIIRFICGEGIDSESRRYLGLGRLPFRRQDGARIYINLRRCSHFIVCVHVRRNTPHGTAQFEEVTRHRQQNIFQSVSKGAFRK